MRALLLIILWGSVFISMHYIYQSEVINQEKSAKVKTKPIPKPSLLVKLDKKNIEQKYEKKKEENPKLKTKTESKKHVAKVKEMKINSSNSKSNKIEPSKKSKPGVAKTGAGSGTNSNKNRIQININTGDYKQLIKWLNNNSGAVIVDDGRFKNIYQINGSYTLKKINKHILHQLRSSKVAREIDLVEISNILNFQLPKYIRRAVLLYPRSIWQSFSNQVKQHGYVGATISVKIINNKIIANIESAIKKHGQRRAVYQQITL